LDSLILGKKPDQESEPPLTAGDLHRASLPVGYQGPTFSQSKIDAKRAVELKPLVEAVEALFATLPDLVSAWDVRDRLDPALAEAMKFRWPRSVATTLKRLGAVKRDIGNTRTRNVQTLYILRELDRYGTMKRGELSVAYKTIKARTGSGRPTVTVQRPSTRRAVGQRVRPSADAGPARPRKLSQSRAS